MEPSIKNENATTGDVGQPDLLTKSQVNGLSDHLFSLLHVSENDALRKMDASNPKDPTKNDSRRAYFSKAKIDALFNANPGSDGLYVYFGAHNPTVPHPSGKQSYENKLTATLVTASGTTTNLHDGHTATGAALGNLALASGKLCPPDICP